MRTDYNLNASVPRSWVVVHTHPHRERFATENLERQEFRVYCPRMMKRVRHARRVQDLLRPMFPGYLFVAVNPDAQRWRAILSTFGVRTLIRFGDQPAFIDAGFVEELRAREVDGAVTKPCNPYKVDQEVRMSGGAFDGIVARIIDLDDKDRLVVLMDLLNRPVKVKVDVAQVIAT